LRALVAALLVCACATPGAAADWYGEFHVGTTRANHEDPAFTGDERVEGAYGVGVGVSFNPYFSTQLDWHTLGENYDYVAPPCPIPPCLSPITILAPEHGWALRALPRLPLGDRFALELGIGWMKWEGDFSYTGTVFSASSTDPFYSLGVAWSFGERWSATFEHQQLELDHLDLDWTGATLRYRF
jgi:opacity protein-like surface antigen